MCVCTRGSVESVKSVESVESVEYVEFCELEFVYEDNFCMLELKNLKKF